MCIALISTSHPAYALILIDNRDEYLGRPTAVADWWKSPHEHVLGGRDLHREVQGTWLGVTSDGRIAVLTNFRDDTQPFEGAQSRGAMVNAFLMEPPEIAPSTEEFVAKLINEDGIKGVGGFSLVCGRAGEPLAVVSNRTPSVEGVTWIAAERGQVVGLSNAAFGDRSWPKVVDGERLMADAINTSITENLTESQLIEKLLGVLSTDTLPRLSDANKSFNLYLKHLRESIFIPPIGGEDLGTEKADEIAAAPKKSHPITANRPMSGVYGTQKQSVILISHQGHCTFYEKSLFEPASLRDRIFHFTIQLGKHLAYIA